LIPQINQDSNKTISQVLQFRETNSLQNADCRLTHLKGYFVSSLGDISANGVSSGHGRRVDGVVLGDDQPVSAVVQLKPAEHRAAVDGAVRQLGQPGQIVREQVAPLWFLQQANQNQQYKNLLNLV
jgi:hypothetical protein